MPVLMLVVTTVASADDARALARAMVERRLAACAQITAIESVYRWQGALQQEPEWRVLFKTRADGAAALVAAIRDRHPYELPAILTLPPVQADAAFAAWVDAESGGAPG